MAESTAVQKEAAQADTTKTIVTGGVLLAGAGLLGYAVYDYLKKKKGGSTVVPGSTIKPASISAGGYASGGAGVSKPVLANTQKTTTFPLVQGIKGWNVGLLQTALSIALSDPGFKTYGGIDRNFGSRTTAALQKAGYQTSVSYESLVKIMRDNGLNPAEIVAPSGAKPSSVVSSGVVAVPDPENFPSDGSLTIENLYEILVKIKNDYEGGLHYGYLDSEFLRAGKDRKINTYFLMLTDSQLAAVIKSYNATYAINPKNSFQNIISKYQDVIPAIVTRVKKVSGASLSGTEGRQVLGNAKLDYLLY